MSAITQIALVESKQAIWEYDPLGQDSAVQGGLDVIAVIRTLAVKASIQLFACLVFATNFDL